MHETLGPRSKAAAKRLGDQNRGELPCVGLIGGLIFAFLAISASARAEVVTIPLPELLGPYSANPVRMPSFDLMRRPTAVHGAVLYLRGTATVGQIDCNGHLYPWTIVFSPHMEDDLTGGYWAAHAAMPTVSGPFEWQAPFDSVQTFPTPTWSFLLDGQGEMYMSGTAADTYCNIKVPFPTVQVDEALLFLEVDFLVPARVESWARVRALYR